MLRLFITVSGSYEQDYSRYVDWTSVQVQNTLCAPTQMTFGLYQFDQQMVPPFERCYVRLYSENDARTIFTGYVAVTPDTQFMAFNPVQQFLKYSVTCTSDEYLLNFKSVPYIPAFINQTQGQILAQLAEVLCPKFFDTSGIQPGFLVPYFAYDPTQTWSTIAKQFGDAAHYYYFCRDRKIVYLPYDDADLGFAYDEINQPQTQWNSSKLATTVLQVPTVNDVTIIGDIEAGNSHDDYFVGDGFTGEFALRYATFQSRTALLLQDDFTQAALNTQNWTLNDPQNNLDFSANALNVVTPLSGLTATGQLIANNGIELAGGIELQHGEFQWNDASMGEVGGLYFDASGLQQLTAFAISTPESSSVILTASGAGGIAMQPSLSGTLIGPQIISQPNHHYVLNTRIAASAETRYQQTFTTKDGTYFGGQQSAVYGDITYSIEDVDIGATYNQSLTGIFNTPISTTTSFTASGVLLPAYAAYALIKNGRLNLTATYCLLSKTPAGSLSIAGSTSGAFSPTGAILPFTGPESEYFGPVSPFLSGQIVLSSGVTGSLTPPTPLLPPNLHGLGFGLDEQDASIIQSGTNNNLDTLGFYLTTTPAAGDRIRFRSNESQRSQSRVVDQTDIAMEAGLVGDDGRRAAVVSNLSPLPRTSEDCDAAAQAYLYDRGQIFYNGTYTVESDIFRQNLSDFPYYPVSGRHLPINCPARNILNTTYLVTKFEITILDSVGEKLSYAFTFGADTRTEKLLSVFTPQQPKNIYTPADSANIPSAQTIAQIVTGSYLPDLLDIDASYIVDDRVYFQINSTSLPTGLMLQAAPASGIFIPPQPVPQPLNPISSTRTAGGSVLVHDPIVFPVGSSPVQRIGPAAVPPITPTILDPLPGMLYVEIRLSDQSWGLNTANLVARYSVNVFTLDKNNIDQTWYMRLVQYDDDGNLILVSRRSKVVRVLYPFRPSPPNIVYATTADMQLDFAGDQRNIYGIEVRTGDDETVMYQQSANSTQDLYFNLQEILPQLKQISTSQQAAVTVGFEIPGTSMPWITANGKNAAYPFGANNGTAPVLYGVTPGDELDVSSVGQLSDSNGVFYPSNGYTDSNGVLVPTAGTTVNGEYYPTKYLGAACPYGVGALVGAFVDANGNVLEPVGLGRTNSLIVPSGAVSLAMGINATDFTKFQGQFGLTITPQPGNDFLRGYTSRFFNVQWLYSTPTRISIPRPPAPLLEIGVRFAQSVQINSDIISRDDIAQQTLEVDNEPFVLWNSGQNPDPTQAQQILSSTVQAGQFTFSAPSTGDLYVRSRRADLLGWGDYSDVLHIPQGDLIASDYLTAQGSVPPIVTNGTGGLFAYMSTTTSITIVSQPFAVTFPNGSAVAVNSVTGTFTTSMDGSGNSSGLAAGTVYDYFPYLDNPISPNPMMSLGSLYSVVPADITTQLIKDGRILFANGPLTASTAAATTSTGSGGTGGTGGTGGGSSGGGTHGGDGCTQIDEKLMLSDGSLLAGRDLIVGHRLFGPEGRPAGKIKILSYYVHVQLYLVKTETSRTLLCSESHALKINRKWSSVGEACESLCDGELLHVQTIDGPEKIVAITLAGLGDIVALKLSGPQKTYYCNGFESHNTIYKTA
jgi:hypothetical protein